MSKRSSNWENVVQYIGAMLDKQEDDDDGGYATNEEMYRWLSENYALSRKRSKKVNLGDFLSKIRIKAEQRGIKPQP